MEAVSLLVKSNASRWTLLARATNGSLPLHPFLENEPVEEAIRKMVDSGY